jgi:WD40 repeat protein
VGAKPRLDRYGDPLPDGALLRLGTLRWRAFGTDRSPNAGVRETIIGLHFLPDGKTLAAELRDAVCLLGPDGRLTRRLPLGKGFLRHRDTSQLLAFSPDGKKLARGCLASSGRDSNKIVVRILDLAREGPAREFPADGLVWLGWSAGGEPLAVLWGREALVVRELASGKERRLEVATRHIADCCVGYAREVGRLAVADDRHVLHLWDLSTGRKCQSVDPRSDYVFHLLVSPDGQTLVIVGVPRGKASCDLQVWDVRTGNIRFSLPWPEKTLLGVEFSPDSKTLALAVDHPGGVRFLDAVTGRERARHRHPTGVPQVLAFAPDGKTLASAVRACEAIQLQDVATGSPRPARPGHAWAPGSIVVSLDGRKAATLDYRDPIFVWDLTTGEPVSRLDRARIGERCAFSSDARSLITSSRLGTLDFVDIGTGRLLGSLTPSDARSLRGTECMELSQSNDGRSVVACNWKCDSATGRTELLVTGWDEARREQVFQRHWTDEVGPGKVLPFVHSNGAGLLAVVQQTREGLGEDSSVLGFVRLEELVTGKHLFDLPKFPETTVPWAFSADGRHLATLTAGSPGSGTVRVWELATREEVLALGNSRFTLPFAFSANGRWLALASDTGAEILLHDLQRGGELRKFRGFGSRVSCLTFTPDGHRLISGLEDTTLLVWDTRVPPGPKATRAEATRLARAWDDLAGNAKRAFAARWVLAQSPEETVRLLRDRLTPVRATDDRTLRQLVADLDSDEFQTRQQATARLEGLEGQAVPALEEALAWKPSLEARRRIEGLLARHRGPVRQPEVLRAIRAVAVLEDIGTSAARQLLKRLAAGAESARQTREARNALERLGRRRE